MGLKANVAWTSGPGKAKLAGFGLRKDLQYWICPDRRSRLSFCFEHTAPLKRRTNRMFTLTKAVGLFLSLIAQQASEKNFKPLGEITGTDSAIEQPMAAMITDQKAMTQLWRQHKEIFGEGVANGQNRVIELEVPEVDFKKNTVIVYFGGQTQGVMGFEVLNVDVKGKTNIVRIAPTELSGIGGSVVANAFGMWVFPRSSKPIELELVVGYDNRQPVFKKVARFEPPKQAKT
jgi:hypothetical protein